MAIDVYPISMEAPKPESPGRFWAIPVLGIGVKAIILIPHLVVLSILLAWLYITQLFLWIPVLFTGNYPEFGVRQVGGILRWGIRVSAYFYGFTDQYPPFSMAEGGYPIDLKIAAPETSNRLWAIPALGIGIKEILIIPHFVIVYVMGAVVSIVHYVAWIAVLFTGNYPDWAYKTTFGYLQWSARMYCYMLGLTDKYPPFSMS
jgi:hypothetical protein